MAKIDRATAQRRRRNLLTLFERYGGTRTSFALRARQPELVMDQMFDGVRPVTHLAANRIEHALGLARSWLDQRQRDT